MLDERAFFQLPQTLQAVEQLFCSGEEAEEAGDGGERASGARAADVETGFVCRILFHLLPVLGKHMVLRLLHFHAPHVGEMVVDSASAMAAAQQVPLPAYAVPMHTLRQWFRTRVLEDVQTALQALVQFRVLTREQITVTDTEIAAGEGGIESASHSVPVVRLRKAFAEHMRRVLSVSETPWQAHMAVWQPEGTEEAEDEKPPPSKRGRKRGRGKSEASAEADAESDQDGTARATPTTDVRALDEFMQTRWNGVLYALLGGRAEDGSEQVHSALHDPQLQEHKLTGVQRDFVLRAGLAVPSEDPTRPLVMTQKGYEFMLHDRHAQVWHFIVTLLTNVAENVANTGEVLSFLCTVSYCTPGRAYPLAALTPMQARLATILNRAGLIYIDKAAKHLFFPSPALINLFGESSTTERNLGESGGSGDQSSSQSSGNATSMSAAAAAMARDHEMLHKSLRVVVETNFQVVAYTTSPLHRLMLGLFVEIHLIMENVVTGAITRDKIRNAYKVHGIKAHQVVSFLHSHAHPMQHSRSGPTAPHTVLPENVVDQLHLWEQEGHRITTSPGVLIEVPPAADAAKAALSGESDGGGVPAPAPKRHFVILDEEDEEEQEALEEQVQRKVMTREATYRLLLRRAKKAHALLWQSDTSFSLVVKPEAHDLIARGIR